jgi:hypothetical protein
MRVDLGKRFAHRVAFWRPFRAHDYCYGFPRHRPSGLKLICYSLDPLGRMGWLGTRHPTPATGRRLLLASVRDLECGLHLFVVKEDMRVGLVYPDRAVTPCFVPDFVIANWVRSKPTRSKVGFYIKPPSFRRRNHLEVVCLYKCILPLRRGLHFKEVKALERKMI